VVVGSRVLERSCFGNDVNGIGQDRAQWISTGNLAGQTVGQLLSAWLITSFGQRKTFVVGLCIFVVSLLVAVAGVIVRTHCAILARRTAVSRGRRGARDR
jgi:MFS family permease